MSHNSDICHIRHDRHGWTESVNQRLLFRFTSPVNMWVRLLERCARSAMLRHLVELIACDLRHSASEAHLAQFFLLTVWCRCQMHA